MIQSPHFETFVETALILCKGQARDIYDLLEDMLLFEVSIRVSQVGRARKKNSADLSTYLSSNDYSPLPATPHLLTLMRQEDTNQIFLEAFDIQGETLIPKREPNLELLPSRERLLIQAFNQILNSNETEQFKP